MTITVTDSRGRSATTTKTITVVAYAAPSLTSLSAERCNTAGTAFQMDGTKVRISTAGSVSAVGNKNTVACAVYYKLTTATSWTQTTTIAASSYKISATNLLLSPTFDALKSYDIKVRLADFFGYVEQAISIGTKQVMMDFYKDGSGIAFGKVAENSGKVEFGWPVTMSSALGVAYGGTGQTTLAAARNAMGLGNTTGALPVANGGTGATTVAAARNALGLGNTSGAVPVANGGTGATTAAAARTNLGITLANLGAAASSHNHAASSITSGTLAAARLPFKFAYGSTTINGSAAVSISYSSYIDGRILDLSAYDADGNCDFLPKVDRTVKDILQPHLVGHHEKLSAFFQAIRQLKENCSDVLDEVLSNDQYLFLPSAYKQIEDGLHFPLRRVCRLKQTYVFFLYKLYLEYRGRQPFETINYAASLLQSIRVSHEGMTHDLDIAVRLGSHSFDAKIQKLPWIVKREKLCEALKKIGIDEKVANSDELIVLKDKKTEIELKNGGKVIITKEKDNKATISFARK